MQERDALAAKIADLKVELQSAETSLALALSEQRQEQMGSPTTPTRLLGCHLSALEAAPAELEPDETLELKILLEK
eukprot:11889842-Karenia_brevis.AAC.1